MTDKNTIDSPSLMAAVTCKGDSLPLTVGKHHLDAAGRAADRGAVSIEVFPAMGHAVYKLTVTDDSVPVMHCHRPLRPGDVVFLDFGDTLIFNGDDPQRFVTVMLRQEK